MTFLDKVKARASGVSLSSNRGKDSEQDVTDVLKKLDVLLDVDWSRIYDAHAAGGRFPARPGDFELFASGYHGLIEVKEVKHDYRLPRSNFEDAQLAKLNKRQLAGGDIIILVHHTTIDKWRLVYFNWLIERRGTPSWDLRPVPVHPSALAALECTCGVGRHLVRV